MYLIFSDPDSSHLSFATVHPSLLYSSFSSPLSVFFPPALGLVSSVYPCPVGLPLCGVLYIQSLPVTIIPHTISQCVATHPYTHNFISVTSRLLTCELDTYLIQNRWLDYYLVDIFLLKHFWYHIVTYSCFTNTGSSCNILAPISPSLPEYLISMICGS